MRPDDVLSALRDDIARIVVDSKWAFFNGFQPNGPNPDRVAGVEARDVIGKDATEEPIPEKWKRDVGVGDGRCRQAFLDTAWLCTWMDRSLVETLKLLGDPMPPLFAVISHTSPLAARLDALALSASRLDLIATAWDEAPRSWQKGARIPLADPKISPPSARAAADEAVRRLSEALNRGSTLGVATAEKLCDICGIRPRGERTAKRCETCASYLQRAGTERPKSRDAQELATPLAAARKRASYNGSNLVFRDQGYGNG